MLNYQSMPMRWLLIFCLAWSLQLYIFALRSYLKTCADVQSSLAREKAEYESYLDEHIISPLQSLADVSNKKFEFGIFIGRTQLRNYPSLCVCVLTCSFRGMRAFYFKIENRRDILNTTLMIMEQLHINSH